TSEVTAESTVSVVQIPSDDMKGRIIGREGRNIRAIEAATGVDLIIDDTPDAVTVSAFDPVRREIARMALSSLVQDGRIHPTRIEEAVTKARRDVENTMLEAADAADVDVARTGGFLHDLGKAVDHEVEGTHALIGAEIARRFKVKDSIAHCIEAHHEEVEPHSVEAVIVMMADAIS